MTFAGRNLSASQSAAGRVRRAASLAPFALATLLLAARPCLAAGASGSPSASSPARPAADLDVAVHVRGALRKDPQLGSLNLGVRVTNGVAHLSGPVPSKEVREKVRQLVRMIPGVLEVRTTELYVGAPRSGPRPLLLPVEDGRPTSTRSASPDLLSANVVPPSLPVRLLAPEAAAAPPRLAEPARLTANPRPPVSAASIAAGIDRLRERNPRLRAIRTEVHGTTVRIFTGDATGDLVMALAQVIARLPGVQHVVVQNTASPR